MAEVLVLVDHANGEVRKTTAELLTIARRLGEPSAVFIGDGTDTAKESLAKYGAEKVYTFSGDEVTGYLVAPQAEILAATAALSGNRYDSGLHELPATDRDAIATVWLDHFAR